MAEGQWTNIIDKYSDPNRFEPGDISGDNVYGGPKYGWVSREKYNELLQAGKVSRGQQTVELVREAAAGTVGKWWNSATGAWEEKVGKHIPDIEPNEQVKEGVKTGVDVAGHVYNWTLRPTVDKTMNLLDMGVQGTHWISKQVDPTGRGIGKGPLGITEALLTAGGGAIKSGGKGLLKHGDEIVEGAVKTLTGPRRQLAYATVMVDDGTSLLKSGPLIAKNPMGIEGLSNVYQAKTTATATKNVIPTLSPEDELIRKLHPKKGGGDKLAREVLSGDNLTGDALELKNLILEQDKALRTAPIAELADGTKIKVSSLSKPEIEALGVKIRNLKENLGLKSTSDYSKYTGAFVIDGHLARLNSKGKLVTTKQQASRDLLEKLFPIDERLFEGRYDISSKAGLTHKHHVRILEPSKVFGVVSDGKGGFVPRDAAQLDRVTKRLREVDNIHLGNQDLHEIMQSRLAHLGKKGNELSKYASHVQARNLTDLQGRTLADADFLQVVLKKGDGTPTWVQQVKNKEGIITDFKLRNGDSIKASNIKETLKYKLHGKTYDPKAVHGFSEEGIELLTNIKGDDDLYEAIKLFYQTTDEGFKGVAGVASKLIDKGKTVDSLTQELLVQYSPEVQQWIKHMQTLPQFKNDRRLLEVMLQNNLDLYKLDLRYERPLKSLPKSDGRRHIGSR